MSGSFRDDMATVNIPLARRGCIDTQADRYKADELKKKKAADKEYRESKAAMVSRAKDILESATDESLKPMADRNGITVKQLRVKLKGLVRAMPSQIIKALGG